MAGKEWNRTRIFQKRGEERGEEMFDTFTLTGPFVVSYKYIAKNK